MKDNEAYQKVCGFLQRESVSSQWYKRETQFPQELQPDIPILYRFQVFCLLCRAAVHGSSRPRYTAVRWSVARQWEVENHHRPDPLRPHLQKGALEPYALLQGLWVQLPPGLQSAF